MSRFGIGQPHSATLCSTVRQLAQLNERVRRVYDRAFRFADVMFGARGSAKLRGYTSVAAKLIVSEIHRYESLFADGTLAGSAMAINSDELRTMRDIVLQLVQTRGSDKATRVNQIAIFLTAVVVEKGVAESLLPPPAPVAANGQADAGADSAHSLAYLERRAAVLFLQRSLLGHFSRLVDGSGDMYESLSQFVPECAADYAEYMPAYVPIEMADCKD